jgi:hypothetical protein
MIIDTTKNPECRIYDGPLLHNRFAYKYFKNRILPQGNIIAFRAPAKVEAHGMIDMEDVINNDFIYSQDMIHFLYEIPILNSTFGAVAFQRLFNSLIANILGTKYINSPIEMDGDDLIVHGAFVQRDTKQTKGKASVSIVHVKNNVTLGHTGINVIAGPMAPVFAYSTNLTDQQATNFMEDVINTFYALVEDMFIASSKTIS